MFQLSLTSIYPSLTHELNELRDQKKLIIEYNFFEKKKSLRIRNDSVRKSDNRMKQKCIIVASLIYYFFFVFLPLLSAFFFIFLGYK